MGKYFGEFQIGNRYTYCFENVRDMIAARAIREGFQVEYGTSFTGKPYFEIIGKLEIDDKRITRINMFKDTCPVCLTDKIEIGLTTQAYIAKYPAEYVLTLGNMKIYLCEYHAKQLTEMFIEKWSDKI
jgi:hypothetical protein